MKTKADELCPTCRKIPFGNGFTLEEAINFMHSDDRLKNVSDDEFNASILATLFQYKDVWHCRECWQLLLDRRNHIR